MEPLTRGRTLLTPASRTFLAKALAVALALS